MFANIHIYNLLFFSFSLVTLLTESVWILCLGKKKKNFFCFAETFRNFAEKLITKRM